MGINTVSDNISTISEMPLRIRRDDLYMIGHFKELTNVYTLVPSTNCGSPSMSRFLRTFSDYHDILNCPVLQNYVSTFSHDIGIVSKCQELQPSFDLVMKRDDSMDPIKYITINGESFVMQNQHDIDKVMII